MVNPSRSTFSPTNPHFFKPLLPEFQSHLKIPVKFFSEQIKGKHEGKTVYLRSDASKRTWEVKMEGNRLTKGWKEFVEIHDLRVGDILVFRHEEDMFFHVTAFGPSFCEMGYASSGDHEEDEETDDTEISSRSEREVEDNIKTESDLNCFSLSVTPSNLERDTVRVPIDFAKRNGLEKEGQETVLMNEEGKSWTSELKIWRSFRGVLIVRGWTTFCTANKLVVGDSCTFRLLQNTEMPVFRLCSRAKAERKKKIWSVEEYIHDQTGADRFVKLTPSLSSLDIGGKQHLPVNFTTANGLVNPGEIVLVDKNRAEWSIRLRADYKHGAMYLIGNDWKSFCAANEVGAGESLSLELIRGGTSPVLKFCSTMEQPPYEAEAQAHKRARVEKCSQKTQRKLEIREKTFAEGEPSRCTQRIYKSSANKESLLHTRPSCVSEKVAKVKQRVVDTLNSIRQFQAELETMERKLEDSLQKLNNLERREDNGNKTTS